MKLGALFRDMPIRRKLTFITLLCVGAALLLVALIALVYQWYQFRAELENITHSQAIIVADNSTSALLSNDPKAAAQILEALGTFDNIEFAMLHDKQGKIFAMFTPDGQSPPHIDHLLDKEQHLFTATYLDVIHPIFFEGERVGTIHLRSSLAHVYRQMALSAVLVLASALGGLGLTLKLVAYLHPAITEPIAKLVGFMGVVSNEKNYALRAEFRGKDELGALAQGLNGMLAQIQIRDTALAQYRQRLEYEVAQRTAELKAANMQLGKELMERKVAEQALQLANEQLSILLESLPVAIYRRLANGGYRATYVTQNVVAFFGYPSRSFTEEADFWIKHIHPSDAPRIPDEMARLFEDGVHEYEYRWLKPDGSYRWILDSMRLIQPADGTASYIAGMWWDITERKLAEEKIHNQQELTSQIIETIPMRIFWKDRDLRYLGCNTLFAKDAGLTRPDELIGKTDFDMGWKEQAEIYRADDRLVMDSNTPKLSYDEPQTTPEGAQIWLRTSKVPLRSAVDEAIGVLGIYEDITAYKQMELSLRESEERFRNITELTTDWVWQVDEHGAYVYSGVQVHDLLGYDPEEVVGKTPFDFMPPEEAARVAEIFKNIVSDQKPFSYLENVNLHKDGHRVILETSGVPLVSSDGVFHGYFGTERDITERKLAAQALKESERRFRAILDAVVDGVLVMDAQSHALIMGNRAFCDMLGYAMVELPRLGIDDLHPREALPEAQKQFERQSKGELQVARDLPVKRKDGSVFFADVSAAPMVYAGQPALVGIFHDVTERKQAEEKIRELNEALEEKVRERTQQLLDVQDELVRKEKLAVLGQVAGSVGHELRNPLGVMNNAVYFLQTVLSDADETTKEYLNIIKDEIASSERIVSDLLDSVRTRPPHPEAVGLRELIEQTLRKYIVPSSVAVKLDIPETLPPLRVDATQIHQVFRNLISNGVEAMPEGGTLEIRAVENRQDETVTVGVRDTGTGIAPEVLPKLFQPLFTTKARGIGLGLVVVKNLTQANGGRVEVQSEAGKGTLFSITLPSVGSAEEVT